MFDTNKVAKNIKMARAKCNMTQMDLADEMGVSYQAVSNWERGNSMPDISKLPDLCKILDINFEELVGENSDATKVAKKMIEEEDANITLDEIVQIAPIVKPDKIKKSVNEAMEGEGSISFSTLIGLAPFMDRDTLDKLADKLVETDFKKLSGIAPFLSKTTLDKIVDKILQKENVKISHIIGIAPFLSKSTVQKIIDFGVKTGKTNELIALAPFAGGDMLKNFFDNCSFSFGENDDDEDDDDDDDEEDEDEDDDDEDDAAELAFKALEKDEDVKKYLHDMDEDDVAKLATKAYKMGKPIEEYLDYMDEDDVKNLLVRVMRDRQK